MPSASHDSGMRHLLLFILGTEFFAKHTPVMEKHGRPNDVHLAPEGYGAPDTAASIEGALAKH